MSRQTYNLNGLWRFQPDPHDDGEALGYQDTNLNHRLWREAEVPSCFESCIPEVERFSGVAWYRRTRFPSIEYSESSKYFLRFGSVNNHAKVWVNGQFVGESEDPFLPFEFDISSVLAREGLRSLVVRVDNLNRAGDVPGMHTGWYQPGGITRTVEIAVVPLQYLKRVAVTADQHGSLSMDACVRNTSGKDLPISVSAKLYNREGGVVASLEEASCEVEEESLLRLACSIEGITPWTTKAPELYTVTVSLSVAGQPVDSVNIRTGFRSITVRNGELLLNGQRIFLTGFNRHEDSPSNAMSFDAMVTRRDLEMMKNAGANSVRLCHYPHAEEELDYCDELGLMVLTEIPLYFWNDKQEGFSTNPQRVATAKRQLERMITRDRHHPSVILWSVSNETNEEHEVVRESNRELIKYVRELDPSRLCVHVSNHWRSHPNFSEDDVICINSYPSIEWDKNGRRPGTDLDASMADWRNGLAEIERDWPGKPILVTEFGYCSITGTAGHSFGEDEHSRILEAEFPSIDSQDSVCGALIWCWADHPWPPGRFLGGMPVSPFGVVSRERRELAPYRAAKKIFRKKQGKITPAEEYSPHRVEMVRPNLSNIIETPVPEGYSFRKMTMDDGGLWTDIVRDAEPFISIPDTTFRHDFGDDPSAVSRRCFILQEERGIAVGTISAWYDRNFHGEEWGRIHWVAIRPAFQGRGLGNVLMSYGLENLQLWHDRACLGTDIRRIGAIRMYLKFGFLPDMRPPNAVENWTKLSRSLDHPPILNGLVG